MERLKYTIKNFSFFAIVIACFLSFLTPTSAAINNQISYQGKLLDGAGNAVADGAYNMHFRLCPNSACSSAVFDEAYIGTDKVMVTNGLFTVMIGSVSSTLDSVDFNQVLYLEVNVGGTTTPAFETLLPRKILGSVPNSFNAQRLGGLASTSFVRSDVINSAVIVNNLTSTNFYSESISSTKATSTNFFASVLNSLTTTINNLTAAWASITTLVFGAATGDSLTVANLTATSTANIKSLVASSTTSTNFYSANAVIAGGSVASSTIAGLVVANFATSNISQWTNNSGYLIASALTPYLTTTTASTTYLKLTDASTNYLSLATWNTTSTKFLTTTTASSTYLKITDASANYLTQANAALTYGTYTYNSSTFLTVSNLAPYLTTTTASSTYLKISNASASYLSLASWYATTTWPSSGLTVNGNMTSTGISVLATTTMGFGSYFGDAGTGVSFNKINVYDTSTASYFPFLLMDFNSSQSAGLFGNNIGGISRGLNIVEGDGMGGDMSPVINFVGRDFISGANYDNTTSITYDTTTDALTFAAANGGYYFDEGNVFLNRQISVTQTSTLTNVIIGNSLTDSRGSVGARGQVLWSTGTSTLWVATSTLGFVGGILAETDPYWLAASTSLAYLSANNTFTGVTTTINNNLEILGSITLNGVNCTSWLCGGLGGGGGNDVNWTYNPLTDRLTTATSTSGILVNGNSVFNANIGIGTSTPQAKLTVVGASSSLLIYVQDSDSAPTNWQLYNENFVVDGGSTNISIVSAKSSMHLTGVDTDVAVSGLSIKDSIIMTPSNDTGLVALMTENPNAIGIVMNNSNLATSSIIAFDTVTGNTAFSGVGNYIFGLDGVSKVGIGINPSAYLDVYGSNPGDVFKVSNFNNSNILTINSSGISTFGGQVIINNQLTVNNQLTATSLSVSSTVITQSGNVGIGTSTPTEKLQVNNGNFLLTDGSIQVSGGSIIQDFQDLNSITEVSDGSIIMPTSLRSLIVSGRYAYTTTYGSGLTPSAQGAFRVIDISDISHPVVVAGVGLSGLPLDTSGRGLTMIGHYIYLAYDASSTVDSFRIIDVNDPTNPVVLGGSDLQFSGGGHLQCIAASKGVVYVGTYDGGIQAIDVSNPAKPKIISTFAPSPPGQLLFWSLKIVGKYLYGGRHGATDTFSIYDISDPYHPVKKASMDFSGSQIWNLDAVGHYAYLAMGSGFGGEGGDTNRFKIIDVASSTNPQIVGGGNLDLSSPMGNGSASYVRVYGKYAYVTQWTGQLSIIDVSSSTNPILKAQTQVSAGAADGGPLTFDLSGKYLVMGYAPIPSPGPNNYTFRIWDMSGIETGAANIHNLQAGNLNVINGGLFSGNLNVAQSVGIGGSLSVDSGILNNRVFSTSTFDYSVGMNSSILGPMSNFLLGTSSAISINIGTYGYATSTDTSLTGSIAGVGLAGSGDYRGVYGYSQAGYGGYFLSDSGTSLVVENSNPAKFALKSLSGLNYFAGNVGIGTSTLDANLNIFGTSGNLLRISTSTNANIFVIDGSGNVGLGAAPSSTNAIITQSGARLTIGGVWTNSSDRNLKDGFQDVDANVILDKIINLPVQLWYYKSESANIKHLGPVAQDFYAAFGLGGSDTSISTIDPAGVALVGIKALQQQVSKLADKLTVSDASMATTSLVVANSNGEFNALRVTSAAYFYDSITVIGEAGFQSKVTFEQDANFKGKIYVSQDSAGEAIIKAGTTTVEIIFSVPYITTPRIVANISASGTPIFVNFNIIGKSKNSFSIVLEKTLASDVSLDWIAVGTIEAIGTRQDSSSNNSNLFNVAVGGGDNSDTNPNTDANSNVVGGDSDGTSSDFSSSTGSGISSSTLTDTGQEPTTQTSTTPTGVDGAADQGSGASGDDDTDKADTSADKVAGAGAAAESGSESGAVNNTAGEEVGSAQLSSTNPN